LLNPPKSTPQTEIPIPIESVRRRGELDNSDYDLIFTRKSATTPIEEFNPYSMNTSTFELPFSQQIATPTRQGFSPGQSHRQMLSPSQAQPQSLFGQQMRPMQSSFGQFTQPMQNFTSPSKWITHQDLILKGPEFGQSRPPFGSPARSQGERQPDYTGPLTELHMTPYMMNICIENLKIWFVTHILKPTLVQIEHINAVCFSNHHANN
jgi:hypothetical protein